MKIYPSLIAAKTLNLEKTITDLEPWCAGFHLDIMDFHFVDNLTCGPSWVNNIRKTTNKQLWVHLMVDEPHKYFDRLNLQPQDIVSIHLENINPSALLAEIRSRGWLASLALNPATPLDNAISLLPHIDQLVLMSVNPGFSGQEFMPETFAKLEQVTHLRKTKNYNFTIGIDGGINEKNIKELIKLGAHDFVMGHAIFGHEDPVKILKKLSVMGF